MNALDSRPLLLAFVLATIERAIKTAAQAFLALITTDVVGITDLDPWAVASVVGLAVAVSIATSLLSISLTPGSGPAAFGPERVDRR